MNVWIIIFLVLNILGMGIAISRHDYATAMGGLFGMFLLAMGGAFS